MTKFFDTLLHKIIEIIPFIEKTNVKNRIFLVSMDVMSHKYSAKLGYIEIVRHKAYTKAFMIYLPEMLNRVILKENFFHFKGKHYLQNHGTAIGT